MKTLPNIPAIRVSLGHVATAYSAGDQPALQGTLRGLAQLVQPLPDGSNMSAELSRLASGRSAIGRGELDRAVERVTGTIDRYKTTPSPHAAGQPVIAPVGSGVHGRHRYLIEGREHSYTPRPDQAYIAKRAREHFTGPDQSGAIPRRGIFRFDTGMGKSVTYGFIYQGLLAAMPELFRDAVVIMASHQAQPARDLGEQIKTLFPHWNVAFLAGRIQPEHLGSDDVRFVLGTYQQLAQEGTVELLKAWAGRRRILFVLDEADMVVFKGVKEVKEDEIDEETGWHASWFRPLIEFGLFDEKGRYQHRTRHYMLGASATLDRPDGISLSTVWGPGNCFYHTPMAAGVKKGLLVPVVGEVLEMDIPEGADLSQFREFTRVTPEGKIIIDEHKVQSAAGSDYAVKTAVRAVVDRLVMEIGVGDHKGKSTRQAIVYASDKISLEKHMRWLQEIFELMEVIFRIHGGLQATRAIRPETVIGILGGAKGIGRFGEELKRFLYSREWKQVETLYERAKVSLNENRLDRSVRNLFTILYQTLNVEARKIKGRPLVVSAAWQDMELDQEGRRIPRDASSGVEEAVRRYPSRKWPNRFGGKDLTMRAFQEGEIDVITNIHMYGRGVDVPMASLIVDNAPSGSRRAIVQRAGRIMRPPDGRNPTDHGRKPDAIYVTVTYNLQVHQLDLGRMDLARAYGMEVDPELRIIRIHAGGDFTPWERSDTAQLELKKGQLVHVVRVGANTSRAVSAFLKKRYGDRFDLLSQ